MPLDKTSITSSITVSTGALVLTSRVYMNPAVAAAFSAVTGATVAPVVTVSADGQSVLIVTTVIPDTPVGVVAEVPKILAGPSQCGGGNASLRRTMPDLTQAKCTIGTDGHITIVTKTFMSQAQVAAVAGGVTSSTSTITTGTDWVQCSTVIIATSLVTQAAAEGTRFVGDLLNPASAGVVE